MISEIFRLHTGNISDKWQSYLDIYDSLLADWEGRDVNCLEIGIQNGGFVEILSKHFGDNAVIVGCDIDERCSSISFAPKNIHLVIGDIRSRDTVQNIAKISPMFDLVIDDGSHQSEDIALAFVLLFSLVAPGGIYVIEDLACSYWASHGGGLWNDQSSMSFLKSLVDVLNREHWGLDIGAWEVPAETVGIAHDELTGAHLEQIESIEFRNSFCVIRKAKKDKSVSIGPRVVAGSSANVVPIPDGLHGSMLLAPGQR